MEMQRYFYTLRNNASRKWSFSKSLFKPEKFENATELCVLVLERRHFENAGLYLHTTHQSFTKMELLGADPEHSERGG